MRRAIPILSLFSVMAAASFVVAYNRILDAIRAENIDNIP